MFFTYCCNGIDNIDEKTKKLFKQTHKELVNSGDFFVKYASIFSSLMFDDSFDNGFIQIADYVCGAFANVLKAVDHSKNTDNYQKAVAFFIDYIFPHLAKNNDGVWGVGIKETPKDEGIRNAYSEKINNLKFDWQVYELFGGP